MLITKELYVVGLVEESNEFYNECLVGYYEDLYDAKLAIEELVKDGWDYTDYEINKAIIIIDRKEN